MFKRKRKNSERSTLRLFLYILIIAVIVGGAWLTTNTQKQAEPAEEQPYVSARTYSRWGWEDFEAERYQDAIENFTLAIELDDELATVYLGRGRSYYAIREYDLALADWSHGIELNNDVYVTKWSYNNRCFVYGLLGEYERAIEDCTTSLRFDDENAFAYNNRCFAYTGMGEYDLAMSDCNLSVGYDNTNPYVYRSRCLLHNELGNYDLALRNCNRAIELDSELDFAYAARGLLYYNMGREYYPQAIADYEHYAVLRGQSEPMMEEQIAEMLTTLNQ